MVGIATYCVIWSSLKARGYSVSENDAVKDNTVRIPHFTRLRYGREEIRLTQRLRIAEDLNYQGPQSDLKIVLNV